MISVQTILSDHELRFIIIYIYLLIINISIRVYRTDILPIVPIIIIYCKEFETFWWIYLWTFNCRWFDVIILRILWKKICHFSLEKKSARPYTERYPVLYPNTHYIYMCNVHTIYIYKCIYTHTCRYIYIICIECIAGLRILSLWCEI